MLRRGAVGILLLLAPLLLAHGLAWRWMTAVLAEGFTDWTTLRRAQGWEIEHDLPSRGGWPFFHTSSSELLTSASTKLRTPGSALPPSLRRSIR